AGTPFPSARYLVWARPVPAVRDAELLGHLVPLWPWLLAVWLRLLLKGLRVLGWDVLLDPLLRHSDRVVLGFPFSREPLLRHGQVDGPGGGGGRLGDGSPRRPVAVGHLLGRDGDVVAAVGRDHFSLNHGVTSLEELDPDSALHVTTASTKSQGEAAHRVGRPPPSDRSTGRLLMAAVEFAGCSRLVRSCS